ncbi:MAG: lipocalin family protein, partial [Pseudomonadota bacterium]|nr:lipocalin family protein [Pseudomonadota bacterium]
MTTLAALAGCAGLPKGITPVKNVDVQRYLGEWYEIARLEHTFEKGLTDITATYSMRDDGGINVVNKGYDPQKGEWRIAKGKAYFVGSPNTGHLKVSFFGPFYGSYVIFDLDKDDYRYSFVTGSDRSYLWLLSRTPRIADEVLGKFKKEAAELGFDTDKLIYVK